jgi:hypothetical protein
VSPRVKIKRPRGSARLNATGRAMDKAAVAWPDGKLKRSGAWMRELIPTGRSGRVREKDLFST